VESSPGSRGKPPTSLHLLAGTLVVLAVVVVVSAVALPPMLRVLSVNRQQSSDSSRTDAEGRGMSAESAIISEARRWRGGGNARSDSGALEMVPLAVSGSGLPFDAVFVCGVSELPFEPSQVTPGFTSFELGIAVDPEADYLALFLAEPLAARYRDTGWPNAASLLESVSPLDVRGLIERIDGRLAVFATLDEVAEELDRLGRLRGTTEPAPPPP